MFCSGQFDVPAAKVSEVPLVHKSDNEIEENDDGYLLSKFYINYFLELNNP